MKWVDRLEKRFGRYAVPNIVPLIIAGQVLVFVAQYMQAGGADDLFARLALDPSKVYAGEWWRLVTFMFLAPLSQSPIFVFFFWYLFYLYGTALENAWGEFRFNLFTAISYFATVGASFLAEFIAPGTGVGVGDYLYGSMFLAFARLYPDFTLLLFFILPVKIKWLALLQWMLYAFIFVVGNWFERLCVAAATINFFLFFAKDIWRDIRQRHCQTVRHAKTLRSSTKVRHECRVCGLTSEMAPKASFRYCSQCAGQQCYCGDHIRNHEHVTEEE